MRTGRVCVWEAEWAGGGGVGGRGERCFWEDVCVFESPFVASHQ